MSLKPISLQNMERTVVLVKPDGVQRGLIGKIIHRFERKGLKLAALKMMNMTDEIIDEWYAHHKERPFFPALKEFMTSQPLVAMVWEGQEAADKELGIIFSDADLFSWERTDMPHLYGADER